MGLTNKKELAPRGLIRLVIYPRIVSTPEAADAVEPAWHNVSKPARHALPWLSMLFVFLSAAGLTFASVYAREVWLGRSSSTPRFLEAVFPSKGLGLQVQYEGERVLITWSRTSPAVRSAARGLLRIEDGGNRRDVPIDAMQIVAGSILYKPASDEVTFRLQVESEDGKTTAESIQVVDAGKAPSVKAPAASPHKLKPALPSSAAPADSSDSG